MLYFFVSSRRRHTRCALVTGVRRGSSDLLRGWLALYADHPDADRIHRLAMDRKPAGEASPTSPTRGYLGGSGADAVIDVMLYVSPRQRSPAEQQAIDRKSGA